MSTTYRGLIDVRQMNLDTGVSEADIRSTLHTEGRLRLVRLQDVESDLTTVRQARNAHHNLKWFFTSCKSGHSVHEQQDLLEATMKKWERLSLDAINAATKQEDILAAFLDAPEKVQISKVALLRLANSYKLDAD